MSKVIAKGPEIYRSACTEIARTSNKHNNAIFNRIIIFLYKLLFAQTRKTFGSQIQKENSRADR